MHRATPIALLAACGLLAQAAHAQPYESPRPQRPEPAQTPTNSDSLPTPTPQRPANAKPQATLPATPEAPDNVTKSAIREKALQILEEMAFSESPLLRANAIEGLHPAPARAEPVAKAGLVDENVGVRFVAAMTIGKLRLAGAAPSCRPLLHDASPMVRAAALYALNRNRLETNQTELSVMLSSPDARERSQAAYVLGEIGNASAIPMLKESARNDAGVDPAGMRLFKLQVAEALIKLGDNSAAASLDAAMYPKSADEFEAAVLAAQIIGEVRSERAIRQLVSLVETKAPNSSTAANPESGNYLYPRELRLAAATALAKMGYPDGVFVADELRNTPEPVIRAQCAFLYGATRQVGQLRTLREMMDDTSPMVQVSAAAAALRLTDPMRESAVPAR
jgi:HEAT repeat protein